MTDIKEKIINCELFTGEFELAKPFDIDVSKINQSSFVNEKNHIMSDVLQYIGYEYGLSKCDIFIARMNRAYSNLFRITYKNTKYMIKQTKTEFGELNIDLCLNLILRNLYQNFKLNKYDYINPENVAIYNALYEDAKRINKSKSDFVINIITRIVNMEFFNSYYVDLFGTIGKSLPFSTRFKQIALELSLVGDFIKEINSNFHDTVIYSNCNNLGEYTLKLRDELIKIIKLRMNRKSNNRVIELYTEAAYSIINLMEYDLNIINVSMTYESAKEIVDKYVKLLNELLNKNISKDCIQLNMLLDGDEVNKNDFIKDLRLTVDKYLFS